MSLLLQACIPLHVSLSVYFSSCVYVFVRCAYVSPCMCVYVCFSMHVSLGMHAFLCTSLSLCACSCACVSLCVSLHACVSMHMSVCLCIRACAVLAVICLSWYQPCFTLVDFVNLPVLLYSPVSSPKHTGAAGEGGESGPCPLHTIRQVGVWPQPIQLKTVGARPPGGSSQPLCHTRPGGRDPCWAAQSLGFHLLPLPPAPPPTHP